MSSFKFFKINELVSRLDKVASENRFDQVSRNIHAMFEKRMAENPVSLVSSEDLKSAYSNFCGLNKYSNFKDYFSDIFESQASDSGIANEIVFGRDEFVSERNMLPSTATIEDAVDNIKESTLGRIKEVTSSVLTLPEYNFLGYTKIAKLGESGLAVWNIKFPTAKGSAVINVPVPVVDGFAHAPVSFFCAGKAVPFKIASLKEFTNTYTGFERKVATQKSGMTALGSQAIIPTAQLKEQDATENTNVNMNFTIPINEDVNIALSGIQSKIVETIAKARVELEKKLKELNENPGSSTFPPTANISMTINYAGAITSDSNTTDFPGKDDEPVQYGEYEHYPLDTQDNSKFSFTPEGDYSISIPEQAVVAPEKFDGIIAFNISKKTKNGSKIATIPVEVNGDDMIINSFYDHTGTPRVLTADSMTEYFDKEAPVDSSDDSEQDAFSSAFLPVSATLNELRKEMKLGIDAGNLPRANACLSIIASKFSASAAQKAAKEYFSWIDDVRNNRQTKISWIPEGDDMYSNQLENSDIFITKS